VVVNFLQIFYSWPRNLPTTFFHLKFFASLKGCALLKVQLCNVVAISWDIFMRQRPVAKDKRSEGTEQGLQVGKLANYKARDKLMQLL